MITFKSISQTAKVISLAIILSFDVSLVYAWTAPTVAPTGGNSTAPLNTGSVMQGKDGTLVLLRNDGVAGIEAFGKATFATVSGLVGIGTASPWAKLTIKNEYNPTGPVPVHDLAIGNTNNGSSNIALTNGLTSAEATITTAGTAGTTDFRIKTKGSDTGGSLTDRFVVGLNGKVGINLPLRARRLRLGE